LFVSPNNVNKRTKAIEASFIIFFIISSLMFILIFEGYYNSVLFVTIYLKVIKYDTINGLIQFDIFYCNQYS
jgi:hypothetical protein